MNFISPKRFFIVTFTLFILSVPQASPGLDLIVEHNPSDPAHFSTIQAALDYARDQLTGSPAAAFRVVVKAAGVGAPYTDTITPISNVPIIGSETARTFLSGGPGPLIAMNGVSNVTIKNFTITGAVGIAVTNSSSVTIANNIFNTFGSGVVNTAVQVQGSPSTAVVNNTFYRNATAISSNDDILITNNIFFGNYTAVSTAATLSRVTYNAYYGNTFNGIIPLDVSSLPNSIVTNSNPLFADPDNYDFHLRSGSPCHTYGDGNAGNPNYPNAFNPAFADMGAYGGPASDTIPAMVTGLAAAKGVTDNSIALSWSLTSNYQVSGYHVYYGTAPGNRNGTGASEGDSPLTFPQGTNSATLSNLPLIEPPTPGVVSGVRLTPLFSSLRVDWTPDSNATGYRIYHSTSSFTAESLPATFLQVDGVDESSAFIPGLTNGVTYYVAVSAVAQSPCFLTVTAFYAGDGTPGVSNESAFAPEVLQARGQSKEGVSSTTVSATPAPVPLGNYFGNFNFGGCFIATAAYGCYSAPQVQALRDFRDRFLLSNSPGRAFVASYYRYGPYGAAFINSHPWCKPVVRLLLLPLVVGAMFLLHTPLPAKCIVMVGILLMSGTIIWRKKRGAAKDE
jgi:copper-binding protein NosD